ncbi:glycosyltransferase family 4 protein [Patescibacteria group bacterium]|nr:glycosyltransferase family 4 protein [Patescibacteria group bacterium]
MRLIYLTAKKYPGNTADHIFISQMAQAFFSLLSRDSIFVVTNDYLNNFGNINVLNLKLRLKKFRSLYYFFWIPFFVLRKRLKKDDIFFCNDMFLLSILIFWRKLLRFNYKICSEWHLLFNDWRDEFVASNSDYLIVTSQNLKKLLVKKTGVDEKRVMAVYGGVDLENFKDISKEEARSKTSLPANKILIGYIGLFKTMGLTKGIEIMIESLPYLPENISMVFVGGLEKEIVEYLKIAKNIGVEKKCIFLGRQDFSDIAIYEQAMDVLVIPYPNHPHFREFGFPMKVYEYMASRRPIIYSDFELIKEVLGDCAYSFKPEDTRDFAQKILFALNDSNKDFKIKKAYDKVKFYTWLSRAEKIINFIKND